MYFALFYPALCPWKADLCALHDPGSFALWSLVGLNQWQTRIGDWRVEGKEGRVFYSFIACPSAVLWCGQ